MIDGRGVGLVPHPAIVFGDFKSKKEIKYNQKWKVDWKLNDDIYELQILCFHNLYQ